MKHLGEVLLNVATVVCVVSGAAAATVLVRREFYQPAAPKAAPPKLSNVKDWQSYSVAGERIGPSSAPVTIVEWGDFQCPFCRKAYFGVDTVMSKHPGQVALLYRHYPIHDQAQAAARASLCADKQGAFGALLRELFSAQDSIGTTSWGAFAKRAKVADEPRFSRCMVDTVALDKAIAGDQAAAKRVGATGTPTFLVNDVLLIGWYGSQILDSLVQSALKPRSPPSP